MIVIDTREAAKNKSLVKSLSKIVKVEERFLPAGDFLLTAVDRPWLLIERKTVTDFAGSAVTHLWDQLAKMCDASKENGYDLCLLIEGNFWYIEKYRSWHTKSFVMLIDSVWSKWRIPIQPTLNLKWTLDWLTAKALELDKPFVSRDFSMRMSKPKAKTLREVAMRVTEGFEDVGRKLSEKLLVSRSSLKNLINSSKEQLMEIDGIGETKATNFLEAVNYVFKEEKIQVNKK